MMKGLFGIAGFDFRNNCCSAANDSAQHWPIVTENGEETFGPTYFWGVPYAS